MDPTREPAGRLSLNPETRSVEAHDVGTQSRIERDRPIRAVPVRFERVDCDTFCSLCSRHRIREGVRFWRGRGEWKEGQPHHVICMTCAKEIARCHEGRHGQ